MRFKVKNILTFHRTPFTMNFVKKIIFPLFLLINASLFSATYAYVTNIDNGTLSTFDLSTPRSPTLVGMPVMTGGTASQLIAISGTYAYVTNIDNGTLSTFDLSTPGSPTLVGMPVMTGGTGPIGIAISAPPPPLKCEKSFTQKTTECLR